MKTAAGPSDGDGPSEPAPNPPDPWARRAAHLASCQGSQTTHSKGRAPVQLSPTDVDLPPAGPRYGLRPVQELPPPTDTRGQRGRTDVATCSTALAHKYHLAATTCPGRSGALRAEAEERS
ncbi:hypothetical protein ZWY2020_049997 [Hordeum vulgare]|nr:hypothetical protein ZWY2020_051132 [Hordeum vulgare]KAI4976390.1 hypothetical protein ZWY2020_049997 [Hordeum vulgare]